MTLITTQRLTLRHFQKEDSLQLHAIFSHPEAMRYWSTPPHATLKETQAFVDQTIALSESNSGNDFVVLLQKRIIGKMGLWNNKEIGFIFAPERWGHGFASEALRAVINFSSQQGISTITADVDPRNAAAIKLLEKHNFVRAGEARNTMQVGNGWVDSCYFELVLQEKGPLQ